MKMKGGYRQSYMITDDELIELYINQEIPFTKICRMYGINRYSIKKRLLELKLPIINRNGIKDNESKAKLSISIKNHWKTQDKSDRELHGYHVKKGHSKRYVGLVGTDFNGQMITDYNIENGKFELDKDKSIHRKTVLCQNKSLK